MRRVGGVRSLRMVGWWGSWNGLGESMPKSKDLAG
jgi:hypothetical protein